jgi:hypothetical protein
MKEQTSKNQNILQNSSKYLKLTKRISMIPCIMLAGLLGHNHLEASVFFRSINVGTAAAPDLREVNWGTRGEQTGGTWGVSSESFLGFTLTSLFDGVEGSELGYDATSSRMLGINTSSFGNPGRIVYRTNNPQGREGIRLDLPAEDALVGVIGESDMMFAGISQIAFDRLNNGTGNIVTLSGFVADPQASWTVQPGGAEDLSFNVDTGTLTFSTSGSGDLFGILGFANLGATLSESGVSLIFSNDRANNNNSYGLVGWQYAVIPEPSHYALITGFLTLGLILRRRSKLARIG